MNSASVAPLVVENSLTMPVSARIRARVKAAGALFQGNASIAAFIEENELSGLETEVEGHVRALLDALVIDQTDPHVQGTAGRVARMFLREVFAGRYLPQPALADFPNAKRLDELYTVGPVSIRSACAHHLCPVEGDLWCGVIPSQRIIGLSKFSRLADWIMSRPQIQEDAIVQLADMLEELIAPRGLAVVMKLKHSCMTWRGVREDHTTMTTNVMRGILKEAPQARQEFFSTIAAQRFSCE